ncbi:hypothetical protein A5660_25035 [Mycobacterium alsense]|uniref:hypothetical protein n=1 Tax=Mycobacterium alsense TaxID=324058 RepID=UPI0007FE36D6|nr:hypothetical protein [Mycobacterium alsense]OBJ00361.1 hypothetical protein A5660_25035 [Mycobacterium alsense]
MKLNAFSSPERPTLAKFDGIGDAYGGVIVKEPGFREDPLHPDTQMLVVVILADNGVHYQLNGRTQMPDAVQAAVVEAGTDSLDVGGHLTVEFVELKGKAKIYRAQYKPPHSSGTAEVPEENFCSEVPF